MLKKLIAPLQKILLQRGICPGCTTPLKKSKDRAPKNVSEDKVTCRCGRVYIYNKELDTYRRASDDEAL
jgi:RNase P subunit RPR2